MILYVHGMWDKTHENNEISDEKYALKNIT